MRHANMWTAFLWSRSSFLFLNKASKIGPACQPIVTELNSIQVCDIFVYKTADICALTTGLNTLFQSTLAFLHLTLGFCYFILMICSDTGKGKPQFNVCQMVYKNTGQKQQWIWGVFQWRTWILQINAFMVFATDGRANCNTAC